MRTRVTILGLGLVLGLGGGAGALTGAAPPVTTSRVQTIEWRFAGNIVDLLCPDALAKPIIGLAPVAVLAEEPRDV